MKNQNISAERTEYHQFESSQSYDDFMRGDMFVGAGGWGYNSDLEEEHRLADWFYENSNLSELEKDVANSDEIRQSFDMYVMGDFMGERASERVWGNWDGIDPLRQKIISDMQSVMDKAEYKQPFTVNRTTTFQIFGSKKPMSLEQLQDMEGEVVYAASFMSSSAGPHGVIAGWAMREAIDKGNSVELSINIPGGAQGNGAGAFISADKGNTIPEDRPRFGSMKGFTIQREFVTNRGAMFRVGKTVYDKELGRPRVQLYYLGIDKNRRAT